MSRKPWVVRAGRVAVRTDEFLENNVVGVGWNLLPDLSPFGSRKQILELIKEARLYWPI